jgi:hypothetical protein
MRLAQLHLPCREARAILRRRRLADVAAQRGADALECRIEASSQIFHPGGRSESDESNHEGVFDQVLTIFAAGQILKLDKQLE